MKVKVRAADCRRNSKLATQQCTGYVWRCSLVHTARLLKRSLGYSAGGFNKLKMSLLEHWCIIQFNCPTALVCDGPICRKQVDRGNFKYCSYWMIKINIATSNSQRNFFGPPCISKLERAWKHRKDVCTRCLCRLYSSEWQQSDAWSYLLTSPYTMGS